MVAPTTSRLSPAKRRTWLFGAGADSQLHQAMASSGASVLIQDLEDFTPPASRPQARALAATLYSSWRGASAMAAVRINPLATEGYTDLQSVMHARPDIVAYPKAQTALDMQALDHVLCELEASLGLALGSTEILPVCETALGVVNVREMAAASPRIRCALLGAEDLAADLCAPRTREAIELRYARQRFVLECRAAGIEPVDAPYTFSDVEGAVREAHASRTLGYRTKSLVRPEHAAALNAAMSPSTAELDLARRTITAFELARTHGEDRALLEGQWIEVPTYLSAKRLLQDA